MRVDRAERLFALFLDLAILCLATCVSGIPIYIVSAHLSIHPDFTHQNMVFHGGLMYALLFALFLVLSKDFLNGQSVGKKLMKLQIRKNDDDTEAGFILCFYRNLTFIIAPIELICIIINPDRRIGDYILKTKVISTNSIAQNTEKEFPTNTKKRKVSNSLFVVAVLTIFFFIGRQMNKSLAVADKNEIPYLEPSYNLSESRVLEKMLIDSIGNDIAPSVRIFDSVENSDKKYVSILIQMDRDIYYVWTNRFERTDDKIRNLLVSNVSNKKTKIEVKYIYYFKKHFHVQKIEYM